MTTQLLRPNRQVIIEFVDEGGRIQEYRSRVEEVDDESLFLMRPSDKGRPLNLPKNKPLRLHFRYGDKSYLSKVSLQSTTGGSLPMLQVSLPRQFEEFARRSYFRLDLSLPLICEDYEGEIKNLSAGGLWAVFPQPVPWKDGQKVSLQFSLSTERFPIYVRARIVRRQRLGSLGEGVAMEFVDMLQKTQDQIIFFLMEEQRKQIGGQE